MSVMTSAQLRGAIQTIRGNSAKLRATIQEALVSASYYAYKDGNTETFNQIIDAAGNGTHKRGITMWIELVSQIGRVKDGKIVLNKKVRDESGVTDEEDFAPFEESMRAVAWYEVAGEQKAESVFDAGKYMERVIAKLEKEGAAELARAVKEAELSFRIHQNNVEFAPM